MAITIDDLMLEVTRNCNLDCLHCLRGESESEFMTPEVVRNVLKDVNKINKLVLSGGEPLLAFKTLSQIASVIKERNIDVDTISIITNGTVLSEKTLFVLRRLQGVCNHLSLKISDDKFHQVELQRKNLTAKRNRNFLVYKKFFGAELYGTPTKGGVLSIIEAVGRAKNLTQEQLDEINAFGDYPTNYVLSNSYVFMGADLTTVYKTPRYVNGVVKELVHVDYEGYLTSGGISYEESDERKDEGCNLNTATFLEALQARTMLDYAREHKEKTL